MLGFFTLLIFIPCLLLGFVIPGLLASLLLKSRRPYLSSYVLSSVILFLVIFYAGVCGLKIDFINIFCILAVVTIILGVWAWSAGRLRNLKDTLKWDFHSGQALVIIPAALVMLLLSARAFCQPLMSPDSVFRWNYLALKILETGGFSFYPPMTPDDFKLYFYVDGMPPLVQFSYFWLYASAGVSAPGLTVILIIFQFAATLMLCHHSAAHIFQSSKAGAYAALTLLSSSILFFSFFLGQETGLTALSMAATVYFLSGADGNEGESNSILAGFATALGALSREYGLAFIAIGLVICLWRRRPVRETAVYVVTACLLCASWYAYLFIRTGNPFYSLSVGTLFPVNEVVDSLHKTYVQYFGLGTQTLPKLKFIVGILLSLSPLHFLLLPAIFAIPFRKYGYLLVACIAVILIWLNSIGFTCGGFFYSTRTLTPMIVAMSIAAGGLFAKFANGKTASAVCASLIAVFLAWGILRDICIPANTFSVPIRFICASAFGKLGTPGKVNYADIKALPENARILSDSALHHGAFMTDRTKNGKAVDFVPVWSPEVSFIPDRNRTYPETLTELRKRGIKYVLYSIGSYNNAYLEKFQFFREYRKYSDCIYEDNSIAIFRLPD